MPNSSGLSAASVERRLVFGLILLTLFLTSLPYLLGYYVAPLGTQFVGTAYNIDDYCNYLSWLRQTSDGHFFLHNLFTTDPQKGLEFNVFFWLLGRVAHLAHLSPQTALQIARVGGSAGLLWLIYRFYRFCQPSDIFARLTAFGFVCLSSGWGWLVWRRWHDKNGLGSPVDAWQPEAYTFLSLYTSALFTVSLLLIVGALYALLLGEHTGRWRYPVIAGLCGAVLGNMHSYDVLHLSAAWGLFLIVLTVLRRGRGVALSWAQGVLALALTLPTTVYQYLVFQREAVFRERANVATFSPLWIVHGRHQAIIWTQHHLHLAMLDDWHIPVAPYVVGYGLVFLLAVAGLWLARKMIAARGNALPGRKSSRLDALRPNPLLFAACWAIAGLSVIYLPFAFQRKMLMGEHVPLCVLAGVGAAWLTRHLAQRTRTIALALLVFASVPSNLLFLSRDISHLEANRSETNQVPFLSATLLGAFDWLASDAESGAVVGPPVVCAYLPAYTGRAVWAGHWGETPHYGDKVGQFTRFCDSQTTDAERRAFLASTRARFLLYPTDVSGGYTMKDGQVRQFTDLAHTPPPYLKLVYGNKDYVLFEIALDSP